MWTTEAAVQAAVERCKRAQLTLTEAKKLFVGEWIADTLKYSGNNQCEVAAKEGVHRNTIQRYIKNCGVQYKRQWKARRSA